MPGALHEDVSKIYSCWRHKIAIKLCLRVKWHQVVRLGEEVQKLRERALCCLIHKSTIPISSLIRNNPHFDAAFSLQYSKFVK